MSSWSLEFSSSKLSSAMSVRICAIVIMCFVRGASDVSRGIDVDNLTLLAYIWILLSAGI
jgi:hypothetical protein